MSTGQNEKEFRGSRVFMDEVKVRVRNDELCQSAEQFCDFVDLMHLPALHIIFYNILYEFLTGTLNMFHIGMLVILVPLLAVSLYMARATYRRLIPPASLAGFGVLLYIPFTGISEIFVGGICLATTLTAVWGRKQFFCRAREIAGEVYEDETSTGS